MTKSIDYDPTEKLRRGGVILTEEELKQLVIDLEEQVILPSTQEFTPDLGPDDSFVFDNITFKIIFMK